jgi:hypothetical protein
MGSTLLAAMETNVRNDLKDLDSSNYMWTTAEIDRHIAHAVDDYQRILPLIGSTVFAVASSSSQGPSTPITLRQVFTPPAGYLWALRVEYPIDQHPPMYRVFREEWPTAGSLYFPVGDAPTVGDNLKVWYACQHTLNNSASTILQEHEELIALGAVAHASEAATRYAAGRLNASAWTPRGMQAFATLKMQAYRAWLEQLRSAYGTSGVPWVQWGQWAWDWNRV